MPSLLDETDQDNNDKLSLALYKLSHRLVRFYLSADIGPEILWPSVSIVNDSNPSPSWPIMQQYIITPGAIAPSGKWFFVERSDASEYESDDDDIHSWTSDMQPGPGDEKEDSFREQLDPDAARPWLLAAARAAGQMPALLNMSFSLNPPGFGNSLDITYRVIRNTGRLAHGGSGGGRAGTGPAKLTVQTHPVFDPDEEIMQAWREAAREHTGEESGLVVTIKDCMCYRTKCPCKSPRIP